MNMRFPILHSHRHQLMTSSQLSQPWWWMFSTMFQMMSIGAQAMPFHKNPYKWWQQRTTEKPRKGKGKSTTSTMEWIHRNPIVLDLFQLMSKSWNSSWFHATNFSWTCTSQWFFLLTSSALDLIISTWKAWSLMTFIREGAFTGFLLRDQLLCLLLLVSEPW